MTPLWRQKWLRIEQVLFDCRYSSSVLAPIQHTPTHTQTDTHTLYPLKTPLQFTAKAVSAKKENLFFSPPHHNVKSIRLASLTKSQKKVWEGPSLLCGYLDTIPAEMMKRTAVEGAPWGQVWKENCQRKGGKKKGGSIVVVWRLCQWDSIYKVLYVGQITQMSHAACCDSTAKAAPDRATGAKKKPLQSCDDWRLQLGFIVPEKLAGVSICCCWTGWPCPKRSPWLLLLIDGAAVDWSPEEFLDPLSCWNHRNRWRENCHIFGVFKSFSFTRKLVIFAIVEPLIKPVIYLIFYIVLASF